MTKVQVYLIRPLKLSCLIWFLALGQVDAGEFTIIPLKHQSAEQILPIIQPLLDPNTVITGTGYKLIVKASAPQMASIRDLIAQLDAPIQQLVIEVSQDQAIEQELNRQGIAGNIQGDKGGVVFGRPAQTRGLNVNIGNNGNQVQLHNSQHKRQGQYRISQSVKVLQGRPALIQIGQSVPVPQQQIFTQGNNVTVTRTTQYNNLNTGFYVTPRLANNRVTLEISAQRQEPGRYGPGSANTQRVSSRVSGALGEWISLGSVDEVTRNQSSRYFNQQTSKVKDTRNVYVKVELDDNKSQIIQDR